MICFKLGRFLPSRAAERAVGFLRRRWKRLKDNTGDPQWEEKVMKKRIFACFLSFLLVVSVLCGCQEEAPQEVGGIGSQGTSAEKKPISGGELVVGTLQDLDDSLEPYGETAAETREILFNVYEGLVKPDAQGNYVPAVASESTVSEDGLTYAFPLREGVTFHNGKVVTPEDVIASFAACEATTADPALAEALSNVAQVTNQEGTITVTLRQADPDFLGYVSLVYIVPAGTVALDPADGDDLDDWEDLDGWDGQTSGTGREDPNNWYDPTDWEAEDSRPVGTGPFQLAQEEDGQGDLVLERFEGYWGEKAYLEKVTFQHFSSSSRLLADLESGALDIALHLSQDQLESVSASVYKTLEGSRNQVQTLYLNNEVAPFDNELVRQAICYAVDVDGILSLTGAGHGNKASGPFSPAFGAYYDESLADTYSNDVDRAKELLAEAGYEDGFSMTITVPTRDAICQEIAEAVAEQLEEVGIRAIVRTVSWETWQTSVYTERDFESTVVGFDTTVFSAGSLLEAWASDNPGNFSGYQDPEYDRLLEEAAAATDQETQTSLYQQAAQRLVERAAGVYLQDVADFVAVRTYLDGYQFYPLQALNLAGLYYVQETGTTTVQP